ncbi:MAG: hypothetical protein IKM05_03695, partial [Clostridia bacterium]|nr:hypothetical protein [Clostridia bacterium]
MSEKKPFNGSKKQDTGFRKTSDKPGFRKDGHKKDGFRSADDKKTGFKKDGLRRDAEKKDGYKKDGFRKNDFRKNDAPRGGGMKRDFVKPHAAAPEKTREEMPTTNARKVALQIFRDVVRKDAYAALSLDEQLKNANLTQLDKRFCASIVYRTIENLIRIDYALSFYLK